MDVSAAWEEHAHDWITWARAPLHDGFWFGTWPVLRDLLPPPGGFVVDLGCGEGRAGRELIGLAHEVIGVERSPTLARAAKDAEVSFPILQADAAALPIADKVVSLVVASMSLMDVGDLASTVLEIGRVLRPGGVLCAAIVHPFNSAQDEATITTDTFVVSAPYLEPRRYQVEDERDGLPMTFVSMHWPLSTYVNLMAREDLVITAIREAGDEEVPWLLAFRAEKRS